jgi:hypothetical protein
VRAVHKAPCSRRHSTREARRRSVRSPR